MEREIISSQEIVKNSIFKKVTYANKYCFNEYYNKVYKNGSEKVLKNQVVCNCNIELPLLGKGDQFYIEETGDLVTIQSVYRTSKDNVLYIVTPDYIDDTEEEMKKSHEAAETLKTEYLEKLTVERDERKKKSYNKENFIYRLFHKYETYDYTNRNK